VAIDPDGQILLVRQWRTPAVRILLEIPAGTLDVDPATGTIEDPDVAARRELEEETGLTGGTWRELAAFYTTPGFCRERMHLFAAHGVERGRSSPEADEELEVVRWPTNEIAARLHEIDDAKTLAGLLLYLHETDPSTSP